MDWNTDSENGDQNLRDPSPLRAEVQQDRLCVSTDPTQRAGTSRGGETHPQLNKLSGYILPN